MRRPKLGPKQPAFDLPGLITPVHYFDSAYQPEWHLKGYEVLKPGPGEKIVDTMYGKVIIKKTAREMRGGCEECKCDYGCTC
jgi:hypothetical protein